MIEIRKNPDPQSQIEYLLFIDGKLLENAPISSSADGNGITVRDFETSAKIAKHSLSEFPPLRYIDLWSYPEGIQHLSKSQPDGAFILHEMKKNEKTGKYEDTREYTVSLALGKSALSQWRSPYSFADYACEMYQLLEDNTWVTGLRLVDSDGDALDRRSWIEEDDEGYPIHIKIDIDQIDRTRIFVLEMTFRYSSPEVKIEDELKRISEIVNKAHQKAVNVLKAPTSTSTQNSIVKPFDFPEEVAVACEQYLLYFTHFLRDLGVKATSDIKHEAGQVLFTITPTNEGEALDKIRTALDVYLHLPASPVGNNTGNEIPIQRLESQVLRFQSDLRLAAAELQAKNATIEAKQLTIDVQRALLNGEILLDSMKNVTPKEKEDDRVEFLDGSVALSVYKDKGVEFNWAKMFKQLRDLFFEKDLK